jgi:hypothetical protein
MSPVDRLKHKLKILAGLPPYSPADDELEQIIGEIIEIASTRLPTEGDWKRAAWQYVPRAGSYKYGGEDMSDLNALLVRILNQQDTSGGSSTVRK